MALYVERLSFSYDRLPLFERIDLNICSGEICAVLGESGCGKSTLLKLLLLLHRPLYGTIRYFEDDSLEISFKSAGEDLTQETRAIRRRISYVPQNGLLFPHLSVADNTAYGLIHAHQMRPQLAIERASQALERAGVAELRNKYPWQLSGGQRQRVALARAMACEPELLLLDEPTSALDVNNAQSVGEWLSDLRSRSHTSIIVVTHNLPFVKRFCDTVAVLAEGRIVERAPASRFEADILGLGLN